jgi:hypothetical protein
MKKLFALLLVAVSLVACGPDRPPVPVINQEGQPVAQQAQGGGDGFDTGDAAVGALAGAAAGYMMGKSSNSQPQRTVIVDNRSPYYGPSYRNYGSPYGRKSVTTTTTTTKRSAFGGRTTTTTRSVTRRR